MKNKIKYIILLIFIGAITFSCVDDNEYTLKEYSPNGGFAQDDFVVTAGYLDSSQQTISLPFEVNRSASGGNFAITITDVSVDSLSSAFSLLTNQISMTQNRDTLDILQIDWSVISPGAGATVTISVTATETFDVSPFSETIEIECNRTKIPTLSLENKTVNAKMPLNQSSSYMKTFTFTVVDVPLEEDIDLQLGYSFGSLVYGTDFEIDTIIHLTTGSTDAEVNVTLFPSAFNYNEELTIYLEAYEAFIPAGKTLNIGSNWWKGFNLGYILDKIYFNYNNTYDALIDTTFTSEAQKITLSVQILDYPAQQDITMPFRVSEWLVIEGTHYYIHDKVARVAKGEVSFDLEIFVINSAFVPGESNDLWLEFYQADVPANQSIFVYGGNWWWTTLNVGKL